MVEDHFQAVVTPVAGLLAALGVPSLAAWLLRRGSMRDDTRERLIEILRKALDKGRVRENAYCGALDALIIGIDHLEDPPPALLAARLRALEIMETAHCQLTGRTR
jgi:hypothetical protein